VIRKDPNAVNSLLGTPVTNKITRLQKTENRTVQPSRQQTSKLKMAEDPTQTTETTTHDALEQKTVGDTDTDKRYPQFGKWTTSRKQTNKKKRREDGSTIDNGEIKVFTVYHYDETSCFILFVVFVQWNLIVSDRYNRGSISCLSLSLSLSLSSLH